MCALTLKMHLVGRLIAPVGGAKTQSHPSKQSYLHFDHASSEAKQYPKNIKAQPKTKVRFVYWKATEFKKNSGRIMKQELL